MDEGEQRSSNVGTGRRHAVTVKRDWLPEDYREYVDEAVLNIRFSADVFQKQAFYLLSRGFSVFVSAHTSSGKTLVAEYAISVSQKKGTRTIYTSPIKALSNQKYHDFKRKYEDVGLVTGDVQVNPTAKCLIMTTEILRNMVYKNADLLRDTEFVVFDEVHYINDADRGVVWEECIIMIPEHVGLIMLSATIPNGLEFSEWVGRTRNKTVYVISTDKRAVPLEHVIYCDWEVYAIDDGGGMQKGGKGGGEKRKPTNLKGELVPFNKKTKPTGRFKIVDLANFVVRKKLTPAIFFCFSKRRCEEYGEILRTLNLNDAGDRKNVEKFLERAVGCLSEEDKRLPQVLNMSSMVLNGVAVHHGSLLPFVKECVELLFSMNLVKLLIATETFAMGVNMPAKCCVFLSLNKIDGGAFRYITSGEYTQMSGRAGRRGMDAVGTVIIADPSMPSLDAIRRIICGTPLMLSSKFKLSFGLILLSLRSHVSVEELMKRSYMEHWNQKGFEKDMRRLKVLESASSVECERCGDLSQCLDVVERICEENPGLISRSAILSSGREILLNDFTYGVVESVSGTNVFLKQEEGCVCGGVPEFLSKILSVDGKKVCERRKIDVKEIFCVLKDGDPLWDYGVTNVIEILELKRLKELYTNIPLLLSECCEDVCLHYRDAVEERKRRREIEEIKRRYSSCGLGMIEEYGRRIEFLKRRGFVAEDGITQKGRAAAEIHTVNEVLVVEMIFSNEFKEMDGGMMVALLSSMVCEESIDVQEEDENHFCEVEKMENCFSEMSKELETLFVPPFEPLNFSQVNAVQEWCNGSSLAKIVSKYGVSEGAFVRLILRLEECCRELLNVSIMIGDDVLEEKLKDASRMMKRDIIFLPSLYL